jgi:hypothetical protein
MFCYSMIYQCSIIANSNYFTKTLRLITWSSNMTIGVLLKRATLLNRVNNDFLGTYVICELGANEIIACW